MQKKNEIDEKKIELLNEKKKNDEKRIEIEEKRNNILNEQNDILNNIWVNLISIDKNIVEVAKKIDNLNDTKKVCSHNLCATIQAKLCSVSISIPSSTIISAAPPETVVTEETNEENFVSNAINRRLSI